MQIFVEREIGAEERPLDGGGRFAHWRRRCVLFRARTVLGRGCLRTGCALNRPARREEDDAESERSNENAEHCGLRTSVRPIVASRTEYRRAGGRLRASTVASRRDGRAQLRDQELRVETARPLLVVAAHPRLAVDQHERHRALAGLALELLRGGGVVLDRELARGDAVRADPALEA